MSRHNYTLDDFPLADPLPASNAPAAADDNLPTMAAPSYEPHTLSVLMEQTEESMCLPPPSVAKPALEDTSMARPRRGLSVLADRSVADPVPSPEPTALEQAAPAPVSDMFGASPSRSPSALSSLRYTSQPTPREHRAPSPTINTKAAMADVLAMFGTTAPVSSLCTIQPLSP